MNGQRAPGVGLNLLTQFGHAAGQAGDDAGKDQQAHAVADAAIGNLLAQPHDEGRAGGQRKHRHQHEADAGIQNQALLGENGGDADGLQRAKNDGHVAGPLRDLAAAQFAFLLDARQRLIDHGEQLKDDGGGDVGHDAQREDGHAAQVAAAEQVHQAQGRAALRVEQQFQLVGIDAGRGNPRAQPVDGQNAQGEEHPLAQIGNPEDIEKFLKHDWLSASGVCRHLNRCPAPSILVHFRISNELTGTRRMLPMRSVTGVPGRPALKEPPSNEEFGEKPFSRSMTGYRANQAVAGATAPPRTTALPPAFSIFSTADLENLCA